MSLTRERALLSIEQGHYYPADVLRALGLTPKEVRPRVHLAHAQGKMDTGAVVIVATDVYRDPSCTQMGVLARPLVWHYTCDKNERLRDRALMRISLGKVVSLGALERHEITTDEVRERLGRAHALGALTPAVHRWYVDTYRALAPGAHVDMFVTTALARD
ncbi:hypothetical protein AB1Y20_016715 [Prymnesium parvum]|uniref:Uncharacterized protein n=1 Tax=Prymnesium parvum TaxID=97485 RepID=A0AB34IAV3_PRYPA